MAGASGTPNSGVRLTPQDEIIAAGSFYRIIQFEDSKFFPKRKVGRKKPLMLRFENF